MNQEEVFELSFPAVTICVPLSWSKPGIITAQAHFDESGMSKRYFNDKGCYYGCKHKLEESIDKTWIYPDTYEAKSILDYLYTIFHHSDYNFKEFAEVLHFLIFRMVNDGISGTGIGNAIQQVSPIVLNLMLNPNLNKSKPDLQDLCEIQPDDRSPWYSFEDYCQEFFEGNTTSGPFASWYINCFNKSKECIDPMEISGNGDKIQDLRRSYSAINFVTAKNLLDFSDGDSDVDSKISLDANISVGGTTAH